MDNGIRNGVWAVLLAVGLVGCGDTGKLEQVAGDYACALQENVVQHRELATGAVEGIVVATGVLSTADIEEGKRVLAKTAQAAQVPVEQIKAVAQQVNCKTVVGSASDLVRGAASALK